VFLQTDLLYLRALENSDLDFLYKLENTIEVWRVSNTVTPYSRDILKQYLEQAAADIYTTKQLRLVICAADHAPIGALDLFDFEPMHRRAGMGIVIQESYRKQYYASTALNLFLMYCRQHLLLHQVYCTISATNQASLKLFRKAGFIKVGKRQQWLRTTNGWEDVYELQKILS
jgi:diamine N-acetyltransferase